MLFPCWLLERPTSSGHWHWPDGPSQILANRAGTERTILEIIAEFEKSWKLFEWRPNRASSIRSNHADRISLWTFGIRWPPPESFQQFLRTMEFPAIICSWDRVYSVRRFDIDSEISPISPQKLIWLSMSVRSSLHCLVRDFTTASEENSSVYFRKIAVNFPTNRAFALRIKMSARCLAPVIVIVQDCHLPKHMLHSSPVWFSRQIILLGTHTICVRLPLVVWEPWSAGSVRWYLILLCWLRHFDKDLVLFNRSHWPIVCIQSIPGQKNIGCPNYSIQVSELPLQDSKTPAWENGRSSLFRLWGTMLPGSKENPRSRIDWLGLKKLPLHQRSGLRGWPSPSLWRRPLQFQIPLTKNSA